jgi:pimeloyl-ACP methyl ester carboxylesterase
LGELGWSPWPGFPSAALLEQFDRYHLRVEVWVRHKRPGVPPAVAVAFGGTVFKNENDWRSNLRWFMPKRRDEYSETVQAFAPQFALEFKKQVQSGEAQWEILKGACIYSVGHSLGGGLAQQFAYALPPDPEVPRVAQVFAFDPSPVTGFYSVKPELRDRNKQALAIDRIYERGEILAILRALTSLFVPPSREAPKIRGVRYALFFPADPIKGHSMTELACRMWRAAVAPAKARPRAQR